MKISLQGFGYCIDSTHKHFDGVGAKKVWPAVQRLVQYLIDRSAIDSQRGGVAVEVGAGCSIPGIALGRLGWDVVVTDVPPLLPLADLNVEVNNRIESAEGTVRVAPLRWAVPADTDALLQSLRAPPDLVIGSDITYYDEDFDPLLQTLERLNAAESIIAVQNRNACQDTFTEAAIARGWVVAPATCEVRSDGNPVPSTRQYSCTRCSLLRLTRPLHDSSHAPRSLSKSTIAPKGALALKGGAGSSVATAIGESTVPAKIARCDFEPSLFLCVDPIGRTAWRFLDELTLAAGVPAAACSLVSDFGEALSSLAPVAEELRASGMLGHQQEVLRKLQAMREQRASCLASFFANGGVVCADDPPPKQTATAGGGIHHNPASVRRGAAAWQSARVAAALSSDHCCVLDDFLPASEVIALRDLLSSMQSDGTLQPGEVSGGLKRSTRGDNMAWVSTSAHTDGQPMPAPLHSLLACVDDLIAALAAEPLLAKDLGGDMMLVRHEMQCTCYPGNGARYIKHVDDALAHRSRRLTLICYANDGWEASHGGVLRLHLHGGIKDVAPIGGRLVLFWSDNRCPHEVLPAYAMRYAVSIWFSDAAAVSAAASAEARAKA